MFRAVIRVDLRSREWRSCNMSRDGPLKQRSKQFALRVLKLVRTFPRDRAGLNLGDQLLRSATSVAANYRAACRARSQREFVAKMGIVEEEADESLFWIEFAADAGLVKPERVASLVTEGNELLAMTVSSIRTAGRAARPLRTPHSALRTL